MKRTNGSMALGAALVLVACGGGGGDAEAGDDGEATSGSEATTEASAEPIAWAEMSHEQRGRYMRDTVVPTLGPLFQEFDGERFAEFGCPTCHGDDAQDVGFEMPNGLAPLNPANIPGMFSSDAPMAVFMTQTVWPTMTELLGEAPYDPETGQGFGCLNCHAMAAE